MADTTGDPELDAWAANGTSPALNALLSRGIPPDVAQYMLGAPSYAEGERPHPEAQWVRPYGPEVPGTSPAGEAYERWLRQSLRQDRARGRNISYQPGASAMPGMPWDDPSTGAGIGGGLNPDMLKRIQMYQAIMGMGRGAAGMQLNPNTNNLITQLQGGAQQGSMGLSPQMMALLNYWQQNQANNLGPQAGGSMQGPAYPTTGGGVDLGTLLGILGFPTR